MTFALAAGQHDWACTWAGAAAGAAAWKGSSGAGAGAFMEVAPSRVAGASSGCMGAKAGAWSVCAVQPASPSTTLGNTCWLCQGAQLQAGHLMVSPMHLVSHRKPLCMHSS